MENANETTKCDLFSMPVVQLETIAFMSDIPDIIHFGQLCRELCKIIIHNNNFWKRLYDKQQILHKWNVPELLSLNNFENETNSNHIYKNLMKNLVESEKNETKTLISQQQPSSNVEQKSGKNTFKVNQDNPSEIIYHDNNGKSFIDWHIKRPNIKSTGFYLNKIIIFEINDDTLDKYAIIKDDTLDKYVCYDISNKGKIIWEWKHHCASNKLIFNKKYKLLICLDINQSNTMKDRLLICLNAINGNIIWKKDVLLKSDIVGRLIIIDENLFAYNPTEQWVEQESPCCRIYSWQNGKIIKLLNHEIDNSIKCLINNTNNYYFFDSINLYQYSNDLKLLNKIKVCPKSLTFVKGFQCIELMDNSIILIQYGRISDSGVLVKRIKLNNLKILWETFLKHAGVMHSEYYHSVKVYYIGRKGIKIESIGSSAHWFENVNVDNGKSSNRLMDSVF